MKQAHTYSSSVQVQYINAQTPACHMAPDAEGQALPGIALTIA
jgi:hypothetical protein